MIRSTCKGVELWRFKGLSEIRGIKHFVTTRHGGFSKESFGSFNLSYKSGESSDIVNANRNKLADCIDSTTSAMFFPEQCHTGNVTEVLKSSVNIDLKETDALITDMKNIYLCILVADCVPVLLFDPDRQVIAAIHAGWRGTVQGIVNKTLRRMTNNYQCSPDKIVAAIGPSISQSVYQVGPEVVQEVKNYYGSINGLIKNIDSQGRGYLSLQEANFRQLTDAGLKTKNIEISTICTYQNTETFYSARKESITSGRFACGISMVV